MVNITAVFLAAGRGVRMGARGKVMPKGLMSIGQHTFLEEAVATLRAHEIDAIRVVTGHLAKQYTSLIAGKLGDLAECHNANFADKGSLHSLLVGLDGVQGPCLIVESDLVFEPRAIAAAIAEPMHSALLTSGPTGAGDEVYVWADARAPGQCLRDLSKIATRWDDPAHGELVGVTHLTADAVIHLKKIGPRMVDADAMADYESGLVALGREHPITCPKIDDLAWAEVDDEAMLARAAAEVYPRIQAARSAYPGMNI